MADEPSEVRHALRRAGLGDRAALGELLARHRDRLHLMVRLRLDRRLQGRVDPSDVVQDAYLEAAARFDEFARDRPLPFFLWLRVVTAEKLALAHRHHLGVQARDAGWEVSLYHGALPEASSAALAAQLVEAQTGPSHAAARAELQVHLQGALNGLDPVDREVLVLRHFEELPNAEAARVLGLRPSAASMRYGRALLRLKNALAGPGGIA